ncbi:MAG TPA: hypothetical protein VGZ26_02490 [Pirellulales bacterium]|nr:hypothetical protein [Pirellulales bacterium]
MPHPLEQKIVQVRRHARRLLVLYALGWTLGSLISAVVVLGLADYLIRFRDHGIRLMSSLAVVLTLVWACYRYWLVGLGRRLGDVQVAQRIERRFPFLTDRLASTVQFLAQPEADPQAGSEALRRAVILQTTSAVEGLDFSQVFERRPTRRALGVALGVGLVGVVILLLAPQSARVALVRMARPFGNDAWPKLYNVAFRQAPNRLAAGQTFEVELLKDADHRLPADVRIHYRFENGTLASEEEVEPMHLLGGVMVARKDNVSRPFWYLAEGGDDQSMAWMHLEVVEPPRLDSLELTLYPPDYTGLPVESSEKSIHALRGTRVELSGRSTKKLRGVKIRQDNGEELAVQLSPDAYGFSLSHEAPEPFVVDKSGPYWLVLQDSEGLVVGVDDRWDIRAIADQPPSVTIEQPASNIFVTPRGEVPARILAKDDLAIRAIHLQFTRSDRTDVEYFTIPLYEGPARVEAQKASGLVLGGQLGESQTVEHRWSLADSNLKAGTQITFWATASDYLPQTGKSTVRRLTIITAQELEERLAQRQTLIFAELQRVLKLQQDARGQTRSLEIQIHDVGQLDKQDIDHAQAAELNQRQVTRTLTSSAEGIPAQIADFLADLENNRVDSPDIERHMRGILDELDRLAQQHLNLIERELTSVVKAAQSQLSSGRDAAESKARRDALVDKSLTTAGDNQDQVIAALENMLGELSQWDSYRRFAREIAQLERDQDEIARASKELAPKTLGRDLKDLDAQRQADLRKLSTAQVELSRRLEKVQQQMDQMSDSLKQTDPLSAGTIADGLHQARQQAISGQMRQSSEQIEKNQLSQAAQQQAKIAKDLEDMLAILSNRREQELTRLVKQLRESEQELSRIRSQQAGLRKQLRAAAEKTDSQERERQLKRLSREQERLQEEASRLARRLERLQAEQAGHSTSDAAGKMGQTTSASQQDDAPGAERQAELAQKDLEEAQQQLAERRRQAEDDLAREQLARLEDGLKSLHERQKKLVDETERLENLRASEGRFTRAQAAAVNDLARQQKSLQVETRLLAEKLSLAEMIHLALEGAMKHMTRAAELLEHRDTGIQTQTAQGAARQRLSQLLSAFEHTPHANNGQGTGGGDGGGGGGPESRDPSQVLTQLKLLKLLQADLNDRFRALAAAPEDTGQPIERELNEIAAEQGKLAELALKLAEPPEDNPEDNPEKLPDVREESSPADPLAPPDQLLEPAGKERS